MHRQANRFLSLSDLGVCVEGARPRSIERARACELEPIVEDTIDGARRNPIQLDHAVGRMSVRISQ